VERVLMAPGPDPIAGPWRTVRDAGLVIPRPIMAPGPELALVPRDDRNHRRRAAVRRAVEPVIDAFAGMDLMRLHRASIPGPPDDQILWRPANLMGRVQIEILDVDLVHLEHRHHVHFPTVQKLDTVRAF